MNLPKTIQHLVRPAPLNDLGPGIPDESVRPTLQALTSDSIFTPAKVVDADLAACCLAGLWLIHDFADEAHKISQDIDTAEGSYWHGIVHRREPDPSNAAYWFRRVGTHPIFAPLMRDARELRLNLKTDSWSPFEFIDLCEKHRGTGSEQEKLLRRVQKREWELLFEWCWNGAVGESLS